MLNPKFRGFCRDTNKWHYGVGWWDSDLTDGYLKEKGIPSQDTLMTDTGFVVCDLKSMGQFTGMFDSAGNELYEGMIILADVHNRLIKDRDYYYYDVGVITYSSLYGRWYLEGVLDPYPLNEALYGSEILGDKVHHGELLKIDPRIVLDGKESERNE